MNKSVNLNRWTICCAVFVTVGSVSRHC